MTKINIILTTLLVCFVISSVLYIKHQAIYNNKPITFPFFVSTRYHTTNLRTGPSTNYPIVFTYHPINYPLKVIDKHDNWYNIKDVNGKTGWVSSLLTKTKKTALIIHSNTKIHAANNPSSKVIAIIDKNNIVAIQKCSNSSMLCEVSIEVPKRNLTLKGWLYRANIWGAGIDSPD